MPRAMNPERTRHERFIEYAAALRERFASGLLSELQPLPQWVVWKGELEDGKRKKVPYNPNYRLARASVKIPKSWGSLQEALTALETGNYPGIGFMLTPPHVLVDLDKSVEKATGTITDPQAVEIVQTLNSYTELSPSGTGLHILAYGILPGKGIHTGIEIYGQDRFTTITTDHITGTPTTIELRTGEVEALYRQFSPQFPRTQENTSGGVATPLWTLPELSEPTTPEKPDEQVIKAALQEERSNFTRYWNGDPSLWTPTAPGVRPERNSKSDVFFVLILMLLTRTGDNADQVKRLYWQSPFAPLYPKAGERAGKDPRTGADVTHLDLAIYNALRKRRNPPQKR